MYDASQCRAFRRSTFPAIPPINLPGGGGPGFTLPPINIPGFTIPPIGLPGGGPIGEPSATPCTLVTAGAGEPGLWHAGDRFLEFAYGLHIPDGSDERRQCLDDVGQRTSAASNSCSGTRRSSQQIGGFPAVTGTFLGQGAVYVQTPSGQVQMWAF